MPSFRIVTPVWNAGHADATVRWRPLPCNPASVALPPSLTPCWDEQAENVAAILSLVIQLPGNKAAAAVEVPSAAGVVFYVIYNTGLILLTLTIES